MNDKVLHDGKVDTHSPWELHFWYFKDKKVREVISTCGPSLIITTVSQATELEFRKRGVKTRPVCCGLSEK